MKRNLGEIVFLGEFVHKCSGWIGASLSTAATSRINRESR